MKKVSEQPSAFKNFISFFIRFGLSFLLLGYIFSKIDIKKTLETVKSADLGWLIFAFVVFLVINGILLWRWFILIKALDLKVSKFDATRYYLAGLFGNLFLPCAVGGDIIKIVGLCKNHNQKPRVVASVLLDRLSGFSGVVIIAVLSFLFGYRLIGDASILISVAILFVISMGIACVLFNEKIYSLCIRVFYKFPKFKQSLMQLHYDVMLLKNKKKQAFYAIWLSCLTQTTLSLSFYLVAKSLGQDISFIYFMIFVPLICVASSVPSIGGLGAREAGAAFLFSKIGIESGIAVSISLINFLFMVIVGLLGGLYYVLTLYSRRL